MKEMKEITQEKLERYFAITGKALNIARENITENEDLRKKAADFLDMAERYYSDAQHFKEMGNYVDAFAAVNYAHAFLDAGARIKFFDVHDSDLFMAD